MGNFMKKILYIFRHGETGWNKQERVQYLTDIELNETDIEQARLNAKILENSGIQHIYSSPLKRAYKTGEILSQAINVDIEVVQGLIEFNGGKMSGMTKTQIKSIINEENYEKFFHTKDELLDCRFSPDAETKREVRERAYNCILDICKKTEYDIIGISTHGFFIREFLRSLNYKNDDRIKNCEVIKAEFDGNNLRIVERVKNKIEC